MNSNMCTAQCEEISYFESGREMCCHWDGQTCMLHHGFEAVVGEPNDTFRFVKDYRSVENSYGKVHNSASAYSAPAHSDPAHSAPAKKEVDLVKAWS